MPSDNMSQQKLNRLVCFNRKAESLYGSKNTEYFAAQSQPVMLLSRDIFKADPHLGILLLCQFFFYHIS